MNSLNPYSHSPTSHLSFRFFFVSSLLNFDEIVRKNEQKDVSEGRERDCE